MTKIRLTREGETRREQAEEGHLCHGCLRPQLAGEIFKCGQCGACYQATRRALAARKITRRELIRDGKLLPAKKGGRPTTNAFTRELSGR